MSADDRSLETDVVVVGSGIAGLTFALRVAEAANVAILTKKSRPDSSTNFAQGGIAAVLDRDDSPALHAADTFRAGAGLCHTGRVRLLVEYGPHAVRDLIDWGVEFSHTGASLSLGREAGHSRRRIVHSRDRTGLAIESALLEAVAAHPRIHIFEDHMAAALRVDTVGGVDRCTGVQALDVAGDRWVEVRARATLLATGGAGTLYRHTTNPGIATGDGIAIAHRAGVAIANMEFIQFHPTALYPAVEQAFLITEALRGEGAVLRSPDGESFMHRYHPAADLAPRDIVARAVHREMLESAAPHVWLDATNLPAEVLDSRFPHIVHVCRTQGFDPHDEPIPVVPAAHYICGGIRTGRDGESSLSGLYAAGECACTGVHGANRLASNSLLEAVVFAERAARRIVEELAALELHPGPPASMPDPEEDRESVEALRRWLGDLMWENLGIVRRHGDIVRSLARLDERGAASGGGERGDAATARLEALEARNLLTVARLVARSALWRRESRGLHFDLEHPYRDNERFLRDTVIAGERRAGGGNGAGR